MNLIQCPNCGCQTNNQQCPNCGMILYQMQPPQNNYQQQVNSQYNYQRPRQNFSQQQPFGYSQQYFYPQQVTDNTANIVYYIAVTIGIISAIISGISIMMPFYSVDVYGYSRAYNMSDNSDGLIILAVALIGLLICIPSKKHWQLGISHFAVALILFSLGAYRINLIEDTEVYNEYGGFIHRQIGCYMLFIGASLLIIAGVLFSVSKSIRYKNK